MEGKKRENLLIRGVSYGYVRGVAYGPVRGVTYDEGEQGADRICFAENGTKEFPSEQKNSGQNSSEKLSITNEKIVPIQNCTPETNIIIPANTLNFELRLLTCIVIISDIEEGEKQDFFYRIQISIVTLNGNVRSYETVVPGDKVKGIEWLKKATNSMATIPKGKEKQEEYDMKVQECIETENVPKEIIYERGGWRWRYIPEMGWRYVYSQGIVGDTTVLVHTKNRERYYLDLNEKVPPNETFDLAMGMRNICRNKMASTELLLYVHASLLTELFKIAGYQLNFVFGIVGVTNSRKTSLVTAIAKVFNRKDLVADAEFATATECGIEKTLSLYKDAPVLIDDFKPGINQAQQRNMSGKLDSLLRLCGNRVAKRRMTDFASDGDKKYFPIEGGCVLTLELVDGILSSLTRLFVTEIGVDEVQNEYLRFYQENKWVLSTHVYAFLVWVTGKFKKIVDFIRDRFDQFRNDYQLSIPRFSDCFATFMVTANLLSDYALERGFWDQQQCQDFLSEVGEIILSELKSMEYRIQNVDKGIYALQVLEENLKSRQIRTTWLNEDSCSNRNKLYENQEFYFIQTDYLRRIVNEYSRENDDKIEIINSDEIIGHLERLQVLDILEKDGKREKSRKLPIQRGNTLRYLYVRKSAVMRLLNL